MNSQTKQKRIAFVDFHRGLALLVMIEVHVFNAMLIPETKSQGWFAVVNFFNGLVAPSFLFVSGFAFVLAAQKKVEEFRAFGFTFWRQIGRIILILMAGYSLHLPFHSLSRTLNEATSEQLNSFFAVDILQTIAVGLFILLFIIILLNDEKQQSFLVLAGALFFILFAPKVWGFDFDRFLPVYLSDYLNTRNGSLFPLFPWLSFMFFGFLFGRFYLHKKTIGKEFHFDKSILILSLVFILAGHLLVWKEFPLYFKLPVPNYFFFILRLGYVLLILYASKIITERFDFNKSFLLDVSRESLLVYWLHLVILFGQFWGGKSIVQIVENSLSLIEVSFATISLILFMIVVAIYWGKIKAAKPVFVRNFLLASIAIFSIYFFLR